MGRKKGDGDAVPEGSLKLTDLPREMLSVGGVRATYSQCYNAAISGDIPAYRSASGTRWLIRREDVPSAVRSFTLLRSGVKSFSLLKEEDQNGKGEDDEEDKR